MEQGSIKKEKKYKHMNSQRRMCRIRKKNIGPLTVCCKELLGSLEPSHGRSDTEMYFLMLRSHA